MANSNIWALVCTLALSAPSLTTMSTFLSRFPCFKRSSATATASYNAVSPSAITVPIAVFSCSGRSVNKVPCGRPKETFSLKLTRNTWSCGLLEPANASAAAITSARFGRMLPLLSITSPAVTGMSS